jgi:hypothetical protein
MKTAEISVPELILIAGTRVALGIGIGLLLADKLDRDTRRGAGGALLAVGVLSTIPIALATLGNLYSAEEFDPDSI